MLEDPDPGTVVWVSITGVVVPPGFVVSSGLPVDVVSASLLDCVSVEVDSSVVIVVIVVGSVDVVMRTSHSWSLYQLGLRSLKFVPFEHVPVTKGSN